MAKSDLGPWEETCERCETSPATVDGILCGDCDAYNTARVVL